MACFSKDCNFVKKNGDCFYDGVPPPNSPKTCEECRFFKPITNYDLLIRKTPEEMAEFLWSIGASPYNGAVYINGKPIFSTADGNKWLDWLKEEGE